MIAALVIGLLAGFAGGFVVGQQGASMPAPRAAAEAVAPVPTTAVQPRTYTDAPVSEEIRESAQPETSESREASESNVARATAPHRAGAVGTPPEGPRGEPNKVSRPTSAVDPQSRDTNIMRRGPLPGPPKPAGEGGRSAAPGSLQIASRPAGAQVFVDDVRVGVTPMSLADAGAGPHRVRIELPGFRRWATTVNVESGARARVGASLER